MADREPDYSAVGRGGLVKHCKELRALLRELLPTVDEKSQEKINKALNRVVPVE